jgi:hypothetical protein
LRAQVRQQRFEQTFSSGHGCHKLLSPFNRIFVSDKKQSVFPAVVGITLPVAHVVDHVLRLTSAVFCLFVPR